MRGAALFVAGLFSRVRDLDGVSIEVMEFGPESQQRRAMNAWKD